MRFLAMGYCWASLGYLSLWGASEAVRCDGNKKPPGGGVFCSECWVLSSEYGVRFFAF